jgi:hypothetical protein
VVTGLSHKPEFSGIAIFKTTPFVEGINLRGPAVTIDGNQWLSYREALSSGVNVYSTDTTTAPKPQILDWNPAPVDSDYYHMIGTSLFRNKNDSLTIPVSNGQYDVYVWMIEDYKDNARYSSLSLEGNLVSSSVGLLSVNTWQKYGPYAATVTDDSLNVVVTGLHRSPEFAGIAIFGTATSPTGVVDTKLPGTFVCSPNPVQSTLTITGPEAGTYTVQLFNLYGQSVAERQNVSLPYRLDVSAYPAGMYLVKISSGSQYVVKKIIKN